jgi:hypothetical protein
MFQDLNLLAEGKDSMWSAARLATISMNLYMLERVSGGDE